MATRSPKYTYLHHMHKDQLPVLVHVGTREPSGEHGEAPVVLRWDSRAEVWFPPGSVQPRDVAHEGLHLAEWAQKRLGTSDDLLSEVVPWFCPSWRRSKAAVKEEMRARLLDAFVSSFYAEAAARKVITMTSKFEASRAARSS